MAPLFPAPGEERDVHENRGYAKGGNANWHLRNKNTRNTATLRIAYDDESRDVRDRDDDTVA